MKIPPILACWPPLALVAVLVVSCGGKDDSATNESQEDPATSGSDVEVHLAAACPAGEGCFICDASKRDPKRLWCVEHDRYEDRCFICHPEIKEEGRLYCTEHGVYEDECYLCHPELKKGAGEGGETSSAAPPAKVLMCNEHGVPEAECAICQPQLAAGLKPGESLKIRVASAEAMSKVGVGISEPETTTASPVVEAYATVDYNQNQVANITPLVEGIVREILVVPGQTVAAGEPLGVIHSPDLAEIKSRFLSAGAAKRLADLQVARERQLAEKRINAASDLETAEANAKVAEVDLASALQRLMNLGLTEEEIESLESGGRPTSALTLRAPFAGTIVDRNAATGERVEPGEPILVLADLSSMWIELSIPAQEAAKLAPGMMVKAQFSELPETVVSGQLVWIARAVDEKTRRIQGRALVVDPPVSLRKGLYGDAHIQVGESEPSLAVPTGSIQTIDGIPFVFVRKEPALFAATRVQLGPGSPSDHLTAIAGGLAPGDQIVSQGSYILRSEFLKSLLGAGCVDD